MIKGQASREIARSADTVYDFVVVHFFDNYSRWSPEVRELEALNTREIALGTRGRQVRVDQGRRSETRFEVAELEPGRRVVFEGDLQARFAIRYAFDPRGSDACRLHFEFELKKVDLYMRPFVKLIRLAIDQGAEKTVRNIKGLVERER